MTNGSGRERADPRKRLGEEPAKSLAIAAWFHLDLCKSGWVKADFFGNRHFTVF